MATLEVRLAKAKADTKAPVMNTTSLEERLLAASKDINSEITGDPDTNVVRPILEGVNRGIANTLGLPVDGYNAIKKYVTDPALLKAYDLLGADERAKNLREIYRARKNSTRY